MNVKRLVIYKRFRTGGEPLRFAAVYYSESRGGWIFNTTLPGRRGSRRAWPTPWAAIPRWVTTQDNIHLKLITGAA